MHMSDDCPSHYEEVSAMYQGRQGQYSQRNPYSSTYNEGWSDHPNLRWKTNDDRQLTSQQKFQNQRPSFESNSRVIVPIQNTLSSNDGIVELLKGMKEGMSDLGARIESTVASSNSKLIAIECKFDSKFEQWENKTNNLSGYVTQLANSLSEVQAKIGGNLPSNTMTNPKSPNVISLRSGKQVGASEKKLRFTKECCHKESDSSSEKDSAPIVQSEISGKLSNDQLKKDAMNLFGKLAVNVPLLDFLKGVLKYMRFLKELCTNKKKCKPNEKVQLGSNVSAIFKPQLPIKCADLGSFTIPCTVGPLNITNALLDLRAAINVMPISLYTSLGIQTIKSTSMLIKLADRTIRKPKGLLEDVLVNVKDLVIPADFYVLDMDTLPHVQETLVLGRPFLRTTNTVIDSLTVDSSLSTLSSFSFDLSSINDEVFSHASSEELGKDFVSDFTEVKKLAQACLAALELKELVPSVIKPPELELKPLPSHLKYAYLAENDKLPVIIASSLYDIEEKKLLTILKRNKKAIGWSMADIPDGFSRYFQIPIASEDQDKTTFTCPFGTFAYRRMPFGLCNAPSTFQRAMMSIFSEFLGSSMEVFVDNFTVYGDTFDDCLESLDRVLSRYIDRNLILNFEKCHFMVNNGIVLGHLVSRKGIEVDKAKIEVIASLPYPTNLKELRSFLGHAGFYQRFVKDFSKIANPLSRLMQKDVAFVFDDACKKAFDSLKSMLVSPPILSAPDWKLDFELACDASHTSIRAVLDKFRPYLLASKVVVFTDHAAVKFLFGKPHTKPRLLRWVFLLQEFDIEIKDRSGVENHVTDHLSRLPIGTKGVSDPNLICDEFPTAILCSIASHDPWFANMVNFLATGLIPATLSHFQT
ncbi:uncharacterized protein LOC114759930 [Neltuma alba]|uniref:uncharacterized protein LOC114759930 n=1 Tax=Neltuma alba TaxID=207710 RepID=UPI0010A35AB9|nr:uncharacterized protein LOC114759930 [Prosopis alba]